MESPEKLGLKWLFLDLNSYFASVEQQENPELRGRPVAVVPTDTDATCAIAASYEAKAFGVKTGTKIYEARKMCPGLITVPAKHDLYTKYHHKILEAIITETPINKVCSIDELSSRLPPNKRNYEAATAVAHRVKQAIWQHVGRYIHCSIGIAPNAFLAKVATDMQKPDGLVVLDPATMKEKLFMLKLDDIPGISTGMLRRLYKANITTMEDFWNLSPKHARKVWGSVSGERMWYRLHGYEIPEQETNRSMVGHSRMLDPELRYPLPAFRVARRLTTKAATRLRRLEFYATCFTLSATTLDGQKWTMERPISPSQDSFGFLDLLNELWNQMLGELRPDRLKKISVLMTGLCRTEEITPDLFDQNSHNYHAVQSKNAALSGVVDAVNKKYGGDALHIGVVPKTRGGYVGTKIAFNRIPDMAEFWE